MTLMMLAIIDTAIWSFNVVTFAQIWMALS